MKLGLNSDDDPASDLLEDRMTDDEDVSPNQQVSDDVEISSEINKTGLASALFYMIIILVLGLPIWIKTTSPSRYSLPDVASLMVHSQFTLNTIDISVVVAVDLDKDALKAQLPDKKQSSDNQIAYKIDWKVRKMTAKEEDAWSKSSNSIEKFDQVLGLSDAHRVQGKLYIFLVDMNLIRNITHEAIVYGSNRFIYIGVRDEEMSVVSEHEDKSIIDLIMQVFATVQHDLTDESLMTFAGNELVDDRENIKSLLTKDLTIIINFIPEKAQELKKFLNAQRMEEINRLKEAFIVQSDISSCLNLRIMSQNLYYAISNDFIDSKSTLDTMYKERLFDIKNLPILLNSIESRIFEPNTKQNYHLHAIIPPKMAQVQSTLFFDSSTKQKSFAASTSYRAGVFFWNKSLDFRLAFKSFIRGLLGLNPLQLSNTLKKSIFIAKWELDYLMRRMTLLQLEKTLSSLESIEKLLSKVRNIVILEEIASKMNTAADLSHQAIDLLADGELFKAFKLSSKAYQASESAFFDPSLLSQLYFPEDQKFAIYLPLFLPVALPLLLSIYSFCSYNYHKKAKVKTS